MCVDGEVPDVHGDPDRPGRSDLGGRSGRGVKRWSKRRDYKRVIALSEAIRFSWLISRGAFSQDVVEELAVNGWTQYVLDGNDKRIALHRDIIDEYIRYCGTHGHKLAIRARIIPLHMLPRSMEPIAPPTEGEAMDALRRIDELVDMLPCFTQDVKMALKLVVSGYSLEQSSLAVGKSKAWLCQVLKQFVTLPQFAGVRERLKERLMDGRNSRDDI